MKRLILLFWSLVAVIMTVNADTFLMFGFAKQVSGYPVQSFKETVYMTIPEDEDAPYVFNGIDWDYVSQEDGVSYFTSKYMPSTVMSVFGVGDIEDGTLVVELTVETVAGSVTSLYADTPGLPVNFLSTNRIAGSEPSINNVDYGSGGYGYGSGSYGTGSYDGGGTSGNSRTTCSRCGGAGVCSGCGGSRGSWEYVDHYTGDGTKSFIKCGECRGSGKCPICYGRGSL